MESDKRMVFLVSLNLDKGCVLCVAVDKRRTSLVSNCYFSVLLRK